MAVVIGAACGRGGGAASDTAAAMPGGTTFRNVATGSYSTIEIATPGRVSGTITVGGEIPVDSVVHPTSDVTTCGADVSDGAVEHDAALLGGAVVWLEGIRAGKPLPLIRRYDIMNEGCLIAPRVQAVIVGGTLNIRSVDQITHRTRLVRQGVVKPIALVSETEEGQVVPLDHALDAPGQIEVRCDLHPWTRAFLAVFDHPYFAVTSTNGSFAFDSVPPGSYTLMVWQERLGTASRPVVVAGNGTATVDVELRAGGR